jgi:hypothetical protein
MSSFRYTEQLTLASSADAALSIDVASTTTIIIVTRAYQIIDIIIIIIIIIIGR